MEVLDECIVEVLKHESKMIICHIRVKPRNIKYQHSTEAISYRTQRWMHTEDWAEFHAGLQKLIIARDEHGFVEGGEKHFHLNALIFVRVRSSRIPIKFLSHCVNSSEIDKRKALALECIIEYNGKGKYTDNVIQNIETKCGEDCQEYDPLNETNYLSASSNYKPYTPGRKGKSLIDNIEEHHFDEPYSPQPICEDGLTESSSQPIIPYSASPIGKNRKNIATLKGAKINDKDKVDVTQDTAQKTKPKNPDKFQEQKEHSKNIKKPEVDELQSRNELENYIVLASSQESLSEIENEHNLEKDSKIKLQELKISEQNEVIDQLSERRQEEESISLECSIEIEKKIVVKRSKKCKKKSKNKHKNAAQIKKNKRDNNSKEEEVSEEEASEEVARELKYKSTDELGKKEENFEKDYENAENIDHSTTSSTQCITNSPAILPQSDEESSCSTRKPRKRNDVNYNEASFTERRRSTRSPRKPSRFIDQPYEPNSKKTKNSHKDLFGSEDDEDDNNVDVAGISAKVNRLATKTPETKSAKKKRKRESTVDDYAKEKCSMEKYLNKKSNVDEKHNDKKVKMKHEKSKSTRSSSVETEIIVYPTTQELTERRNKEIIEIENHLRLREELEKLAGPKPQKTEELSLNDMSAEDILATFTEHKLLLDEIFDKLKNKSTVRSYNGNNHYLVIHLIDSAVQLTMMNKLTDEYGNTTTDPTLFANAMMPEWIVAIFMERFKFKRDEAIAQIRAQEEYKFFLDSQTQSD